MTITMYERSRIAVDVTPRAAAREAGKRILGVAVIDSGGHRWRGIGEPVAAPVGSPYLDGVSSSQSS
ncbi:hypothetical protein GCM10009608_18730 [Pseudonocardia alaniniphila]